MTFKELEEKLKLILPNADIQTDNDGQLIIYTGLIETNEGLVDFEDDSEESVQ